MSKKQTRMTVDEFAADVLQWITESADMDDLQQFAAEFYGVPLELVAVNDCDEITIEKEE